MKAYMRALLYMKAVLYMKPSCDFRCILMINRATESPVCACACVCKCVRIDREYAGTGMKALFQEFLCCFFQSDSMQIAKVVSPK